MRKQTYYKQQGFILPSVLLIGIGVLLIGVSLIQTSTSVRASIENKYYNDLAREASEAGVAYARYCLKKSDTDQTWGPALSRPNLSQTTDCNGTALTRNISSLTGVPDAPSSFSVGDVDLSPSTSVIVNANGTSARGNLRGETLASFKSVVKTAIAPPSIAYSGVAFGYYYYSSATRDQGAFYAVQDSKGIYKATGQNTLGLLGNGTTNSTTKPTQFILPNGKIGKQAFSSFLSQGYNLFIITTDGRVYGAGQNNFGQLGNTPVQDKVPTPIEFQIPSYETARMVAINGEQTFVVTDSNRIYGAGNCDDGQIGSGCTSGSHVTPEQVQGLPTPDSSDPNTIPAEISLDYRTTVMRTQGGQVYAWGRESNGIFGDGKSDGAVSATAKQLGTFGMPGYPTAKQIAIDGVTLYVLDSNGDVWCTGMNTYGECGYSPSGDISSFRRFPIPSGAKQIATDQWSVLILMDNGDVYGAGLNRNGELGNGYLSNSTNSPTKVRLNGKKATFVYNSSLGTNASGLYNSTLMIMDDGSVWGMGSNYFGQLGDGTTGDSTNPNPVPMKVVDGVKAKAVDVKTGLGSSIVLLDNGSYMTVGNNKYGQLGNGTTQDYNTPITPQYINPVPTFLF